MIDTKNLSKRYMIEMVIGVAFCYFLLGGYSWPRALWALVTIFFVWIAIKNVLRETGLESEGSYERGRQWVGLLLIISLLVTPLWQESWWAFIVGLVLGAVWLSDVRKWQRMRSLENVNAEVKDHGHSA